jgi:hypothetical protein
MATQHHSFDLGNKETIQKFRDVYSQLRADRNSEQEKQWKAMMNGKQSIPGISANQDSLGLVRVWEKVARNTDFDGFLEFVGNGESPALKLTQAEMALAKGGNKQQALALEIIGAASVCIGMLILT